MLTWPSFPSQVLDSSRGETDSCDPLNMQLSLIKGKTYLKAVSVAGRPGR